MTKGVADVYFGDTPVITTLVAQNSSLVAGAELVAPAPIGIALRIGDTRLTKVKKAISDMYTDGTMQTILAKWKLTRFAVTP